MLELDTWLNRFLEHGYAELPIALKRRFVYLLAQEDMTLYDWLTGRVQAPAEFQELVEVIRATSTHRFPA
jgi:succinate dehydrogenase flavin-adding protein (antitoxin of CptAB toxin-antitoxin module)